MSGIIARPQYTTPWIGTYNPPTNVHYPWYPSHYWVDTGDGSGYWASEPYPSWPSYPFPTNGNVASGPDENGYIPPWEPMPDRNWGFTFNQIGVAADVGATITKAYDIQYVVTNHLTPTIVMGNIYCWFHVTTVDSSPYKAVVSMIMPGVHALQTSEGYAHCWSDGWRVNNVVLYRPGGFGALQSVTRNYSVTAPDQDGLFDFVDYTAFSSSFWWGFDPSTTVMTKEGAFMGVNVMIMEGLISAGTASDFWLQITGTWSAEQQVHCWTDDSALISVISDGFGIGRHVIIKGSLIPATNRLSIEMCSFVKDPRPADVIMP